MKRIGKMPYYARAGSRWRVVWWDSAGQKRKFVANEKIAKTEVERLTRDVTMYGKAADVFTAEERVDAAMALRLLRPHGLTLLEVVRGGLGERKVGELGKPLVDAVCEYFSEKSGLAWSWDAKRQRFAEDEGRQAAGAHSANMKFYLGKFLRETMAEGCADVGREGLQGVFDTMVKGGAAAKSVRNHRLYIHAFFEFARRRGWVKVNPVADTTAPRLVESEVGTLDAAQCAALLAAADERIRSYLVLQLFCGLRASEAARATWEDIKIDKKANEWQIVLASAKTKKSARRAAIIGESGKAWLQLVPAKERKGAVLSTVAEIKILKKSGKEKVNAKAKQVTRRLFEVARKAAGIEKWPKNALRHTCISCRVALELKLHDIAYECGTSSDMIKQHYNGVFTKTQAREIWAVMPEGKKKPQRVKVSRKAK